MNKYPIFIPTKGRFKTPYTMRAFDRIGIDYKIVIEASEWQAYKMIVPEERILVVPHKDKGVTVTRNWIWDYAQARGFERYWSFDDNIEEFYRLNHNIKWRIRTPSFMKPMEDFADRYENAHIVGMQYEHFAPRKAKLDPFRLNTRVYSNMLIKTDLPYRFKTFYNEDTDLCIRLLRDGHCRKIQLSLWV